MEFHQLRYVLAVVDTGSFTAAAAAVRVSQSGVSTQVQKLERELGVALFDRSGRLPILTADGERMLPALRAAVDAIGDVRSTADDLRGLVVGSLRVGTASGITWPRLFDALAALHTAHPGVDVRLREDTSHQLIEALHRGETDVALVSWSQNPPEGLESRIVFDDRLVAVVAAQHPWVSRRSIRPAELSRVDLISLPVGAGDRTALSTLLPDVVPRWEVSTPSFVERLAARGLGVGVVSEATSRRWEDVRSIPIDSGTVRSRLGIVWRPRPTRAARALIDLLSAD